ncbi:hypothetical protein CUJ83_11725 [Methanocella sp. CWC-04]|uniref:VWFA domain-containing protein n=1 Tax=Methanooceanicella nereidis TaxID=2052831 RepID=A0AAP2RDL5_9EURY|nr:VWA domain-containing protein [Methanocella sp. CWC-04]MCD1295666.1 hypothetical protein [Methanocella sp. CWC-04]
MIFADEQKLLEACAYCTKDPNDVHAYEDFLNGCRSIGRNFLRLYQIMPPTIERMVYTGYCGNGIISQHKTMSGFCSSGRSLDNVISRYRVRDIKKIHLAIMYDDSNSMTAWWRNQTMAATIPESRSPQTYSKIACISLMEGLSRNMDMNLWTFGSKADGPFNIDNNMYKELLIRNGSGGTRLDLALESVIDFGWDKKSGIKILIVLTDGIPEMGRSVYDEDVMINIKTLDLLQDMLNKKVKVLYLQLLTDESRKFKKSGGYTMKEFGKNLEKMGCNVINVDTASRISDSLFNGLYSVVKKL